MILNTVYKLQVGDYAAELSVPCRVGSVRGAEVIDRIVAGEDRDGNLALIGANDVTNPAARSNPSSSTGCRSSTWTTPGRSSCSSAR